MVKSNTNQGQKMSIANGQQFRDTWTNEIVTVDRVEDLGGLPFVYYTENECGDERGRPVGSFLDAHVPV